MERILITGGAGYIGSVLCEKLLQHNYEVTVLDNLMYKQTSLAHLVREKKLKFIYGDVRDFELIRNLVNSHDVIIPLAAIVGAPACDRDPFAATSINKDSIFKLLEISSMNQRIIMPTTNSAYGSGDKNNYCDENSKLNPLSLYARDKVEVEMELMRRGNATSFRLATVFGISPRMRLDLLVNSFVHKAMTDKYIVVFEGHFKRNYIHILDVAEAFIMALEQPDKFNGQIFNVGLSTANVSKIELCHLIKEQLENFHFMESDIGKDPDQRNYIVSNEKIESLGFAPKVTLEEGITELIKGLIHFNIKPFSNI